MTKLEIYEEMMREAVYLRLYKEVPHQAIIICKSHSTLSNGKDELLFDLLVESENQQRMAIGSKGRNIT
jgi:GTPase Era involved in 16S rRNA processing